MVARKPFTQSSIEERKCWPETRAALHGPEDYEKCGILSNKQRAELIQFARVAPEQAKPLIDEVTCVINGYRHRKRANAQESPAAVAASMRQLIDALEQVVKGATLCRQGEC